MKNKIKYILKTSVISLFLIVNFVACNKVVEHDLIITNINIVDVITGEIKENQTVAIDSDSITAIYEKEQRHSDSTKVIDGHGKFLIPGLWDMHTHYHWTHTDANPIIIANGVTGVRDMWGNMEVINDIRNKIEAGEIIAPDIYTAGNIIDGDPPNWQGSAGVATPEEAIIEVNQQIDLGVDFIKVYTFLSEECFTAIAELANKRNKPFAGHVPKGMSIYQTIDAGMICSEHLDGILSACSSKEDSLKKLTYREFIKASYETFNEEKFDSLCDVLAQSNMWLCPTLTAICANGYRDDTTFTNDNRIDYFSENFTSWWKSDKTPDFIMDSRNRYLLQESLIGKMNKRGVKFIAGTDYPNPYCFPGFSIHDELSLFVKGGMSELDALKAATINGAVFMGKENEFGSVEVGKLASLVLLNKNPLENIENTKSIESVILRGKVFDRTALDEMLEQAKLNAAKKP